MFYIETNSSDPYYQLALEEYIFTHLDPSAEYCLLWQSRNTIYVARNQNTADEIDQYYVDSQGIRVARRLSGGKAIYLDHDNLAFTYIAKKDTDPDAVHDRFAEALLQTLQELGISAEYDGRILTIGGKRFSDSSMFLSHGRMIYHGYVRLDSDPKKLHLALHKNRTHTENSGKSARVSSTSVNAHVKPRVSYQIFKNLLKQHLFRGDVKPYTLSSAEKEAVLDLLEEKYETWEWNYGTTGH